MAVITVFPHIRPTIIIILCSLQMGVLLGRVLHPTVPEQCNIMSIKPKDDIRLSRDLLKLYIFNCEKFSRGSRSYLVVTAVAAAAESKVTNRFKSYK